MSAERRRIFAFSAVLKPQPDGPPPAVPSAGLSYITTAVGDRQDAIDHCTTRSAERDDAGFSVLRLFAQPNVPDVRAHLLSRAGPHGTGPKPPSPG